MMLSVVEPLFLLQLEAGNSLSTGACIQRYVAVSGLPCFVHGRRWNCQRYLDRIREKRGKRSTTTLHCWTHWKVVQQIRGWCRFPPFERNPASGGYASGCWMKLWHCRRNSGGALRVLPLRAHVLGFVVFDGWGINGFVRKYFLDNVG